MRRALSGSCRRPRREARSTTPHSDPWTPSTTQPAKALAQRAGVEGGQDLVPDLPRLVDGDDGVERLGLVASGHRHHHQQVGPVGVEAGLLVKGRILPGILPAVAALFLAADDPVHGADPVAGVGVADGVEQGLDLPVEDGAGDELAAALALHELPVGVDEDYRVRRGLSQGDAAGRNCQERRQKQRGCQG